MMRCARKSYRAALSDRLTICRPCLPSDLRRPVAPPAADQGGLEAKNREASKLAEIRQAQRGPHDAADVRGYGKTRLRRQSCWRPGSYRLLNKQYLAAQRGSDRA